MNQQIKPSEIVIMASGAVGFLLTLPFMAWYSFEGGPGFGGDDLSAWNTDLPMFPLATYIPLIGLVLAVQIALAKFANVQMPLQVAGFSWPQIRLVLAVFTGLLAIGWLIAGTPLGADWGPGFFFGFLCAVGLVTGAILETVEARKAGMGAPGAYPGGPAPGQQPPPPPPGPQQPPQQF